MASKPKVPQPPPPTQEEMIQQQEAERAAIEARERARVDRVQIGHRNARDQAGMALGLRGRKALLSSAGEAGFPSGLGGV